MTTDNATKMSLKMYMDLPYYKHEGEGDDAINDAASKTYKLRTSLTPLMIECDEAINTCYTITIIASMDGAFGDLADKFLSEAAACRIEWIDSAQSPPSFSLASDATVPNGRARNFSGRISECEYLADSFEQSGGGAARSFYRFVVRPLFWFMGQQRHNRTWLDANVKTVLESVLKTYGQEVDGQVPAGEWSLSDAMDTSKVVESSVSEVKPLFKERPFVFQYEETDFAFFTRWVERQGYYYFFTFDDQKPDANGLLKSYKDEKITVVSDNLLKKCGGGDDAFLRFAQSTQSKLGYSGKSARKQFAPVQVVVHDYNPDDPSSKMEAKWPATPDEKGLAAVLLENEFFDTPGEGKAIAFVRKEGFESRKNIHELRTNVPGVTPGFTFLPYAEGRTEGEWATKGVMVEKAHHYCFMTDPATLAFIKTVGVNPPEAGYSNTATAVEYASPYHPAKSVPQPNLTRPVTGWVLPVDDVATVTVGGKYYVRIMGVEPRDCKAKESGSAGPMRAVSPSAAFSSGPAVQYVAGTEVVVGFMDGNPDRPFIMGTVRNADTGLDHINNQDATQFVDGKSLVAGANSFSADISGGGSFSMSGGETSFSNSSTSISAGMTNSVSGRFNSNSGMFVNSMGADTDTTDAIAIVNRVISYLNTIATPTLDATTGAGADKVKKVNVTDVVGQSLGALAKYINVVTSIVGIAKSDARMQLTAGEKTANLTNYAPIASGVDLTLLITDFAAELADKLVPLSKNYASINGKVDDYGSSYDSDIWAAPFDTKIHAHFGTTMAIIAADVVAFAAAAAVARLADVRLKDKGVAIIAQNTSSLPNLGLDIQTASDGPTGIGSNRSVSITSVPKYVEKRKDSTITFADKDKAVIQLDAGAPAVPPAAAQLSKISAHANDQAFKALNNFDIEAGETLTVSAKDMTAPQTAKAQVKISKSGDGELKGDGAGTIDFTNSATLSSTNGVTVTGGNVLVGGKKSGVVLATLKSDGSVDDDSPKISLNSNPATLAAYLTAHNDWRTKKDEWIAATEALRKAERDWDADKQKLKTEFTDAGKLLSTEYLPLKAKVEVQHPNTVTQKRTALDQKKAAMDTAKTEKKTKFSAMSADHTIILSNGSGQSQKVTIDKTSIVMESNKKIVLKGAGGEAFTVDIQGKKVNTTINNGEIVQTAMMIKLG